MSKLKNVNADAGFDGRDGWQAMFEIHADDKLRDRYPIQLGPAKCMKLMEAIKLNGATKLVAALAAFVKKNPPKKMEAKGKDEAKVKTSTGKGAKVKLSKKTAKKPAKKKPKK